MTLLGDIRTTDYWSLLVKYLPHNFEILQSLDSFLVRRRNLTDIESFLRMCLIYALTDMPMQNTCVWAKEIDLMHMSPPAFFKRFCKAYNYMSQLLKEMLNEPLSNNSMIKNGINIKIIDATCIQGPGAKGTDFRLHTAIRADSTGYRWMIDDIHLTDEKIGETFRHFDLKPNDLVIGDRGYGNAKGVCHLTQYHANVLVRINPSGIRICNNDKQVIKLNKFEQEVRKTGCLALDYLLPIPPEKKSKRQKSWKLKDASAWLKVRIVGCRNNKGEVTWLLTTVPRQIIDDKTIAALYRIRWQIEIEFKKLKSLANLGKLPSPNKGPSAKSWIVARLLGILLVERINEAANLACPPEKNEDYDTKTKKNPKQISRWREFHLALWTVRTMVLGNSLGIFYSFNAREGILSSRRKRRNQRCPIIPSVLNNPP